MDRPGLIFDLDGTLVDSLPGIAGSLNRALEGLKLPTHTRKDVRDFIGNGSLELVRRVLPAGSDLAETGDKAFKEDYAVTWPDGTYPYTGIPELLNDLAGQGFRLAVLSNKPHPFTVEIVEKLFPNVTFDLVLGQREDVPKKPHPEAALQIVRQWNTTPENCRFIGDSTVDLATAKAARIPSIAVLWGYHDKEPLIAAGADFFAHEIADIAPILGIA